MTVEHSISVDSELTCDPNFIIHNLSLVIARENSDGLLRLSHPSRFNEPTGGRVKKAFMDDPNSLREFFEIDDDHLVTPENVCRPIGHTTLFTSAGIQRIETLLMQEGKLHRQAFIVFQPVLRSQFMDKIREGTSTSFINLSAVAVISTPREYIDYCIKLIFMAVNNGVDAKDLLFGINEARKKWGTKDFDSICMTLYLGNTELGECSYIKNYPVQEEEEISIVDLGLGIERFAWGIGIHRPYFYDFERFYRFAEDSETRNNQITSVIDAVRSMVLIANDGIKPSNNNHGYRLRQFSKRFIERNRGININAEDLIRLSYESWIKWGYQPKIAIDDIINIITTENDRNLNSLFLRTLKERFQIDVYVDINQGRNDFLRQIRHSIQEDVLHEIMQMILYEDAI